VILFNYSLGGRGGVGWGVCFPGGKGGERNMVFGPFRKERRRGVVSPRSRYPRGKKGRGGGLGKSPLRDGRRGGVETSSQKENV